MAIKFHTNIRNLAIGRGILAAGFNAASSISIYSGTQPTASDILANWANYTSNNAAFLAHYVGGIWTQPLSGDATFASLTTFPADVVPTHAGTGEWCILWPSNVSATSVVLSTIPNLDFIVGPVTSLTGGGIIRFSPDTVFATGVAKGIADGVISASSN